MEKKNKIALVTGGSRGIGKDTALRLAGKGLDVIITYNAKADDANEVVAQIEKAGQKAAALQLSIGEIKGLDDFTARLQEILQHKFNTDRFDFLVNNAGSGAYGMISAATEEFFDHTLNVHFKGVYFLTQKLIPVLNDGGGIVNVATALTRLTSPNSSVYACMKSAVETFTRYVAKEYGARGIRANTVAPGPVMTDFGDAHIRSNPELQKMLSSVTALGRVGVAEDLGGVISFLCTEDARWVNGQRIEVSGGIQL